MSWTIEFFDESVEAETFPLPPKILAKIYISLNLIEMAGAQLGEPYIKQLNDVCLKCEPKPKRAEDHYLALFCQERSKYIQKRS